MNYHCYSDWKYTEQSAIDGKVLGDIPTEEIREKGTQGKVCRPGGQTLQSQRYEAQQCQYYAADSYKQRTDDQTRRCKKGRPRSCNASGTSDMFTPSLFLE
jgi:hypothetical protein